MRWLVTKKEINLEKCTCGFFRASNEGLKDKRVRKTWELKMKTIPMKRLTTIAGRSAENNYINTFVAHMTPKFLWKQIVPFWRKGGTLWALIFWKFVTNMKAGWKLTNFVHEKMIIISVIPSNQMFLLLITCGIATAAITNNTKS